MNSFKQYMLGTPALRPPPGTITNLASSGSWSSSLTDLFIIVTYLDISILSQRSTAFVCQRVQISDHIEVFLNSYGTPFSSSSTGFFSQSDSFLDRSSAR